MSSQFIFLISTGTDKARKLHATNYNPVDFHMHTSPPQPSQLTIRKQRLDQILSQILDVVMLSERENTAVHLS